MALYFRLISPRFQEILHAVDPLRRPDPFGLEAELDAVLWSGESPTDASVALAIALAETLLTQYLRCDVIYTHNVLALVQRAAAAWGESIEDQAALLRIRMHCVAARALTLHLPGDKASNLAQAALHLSKADELAAATIDPERLAAALLDFVHASELAPGKSPQVDVPAVYRWILEVSASGAAPDVHAVALANLNNEEAAPNADSTTATDNEPDTDSVDEQLEAFGY
jgi:hypothetical protein